MTYDYHGSWESRTGHVAPLYGRPDDTHPQYNTNYTIEYLTQRGAAREKLLLGVPFYGQSFTLARDSGKSTKQSLTKLNNSHLSYFKFRKNILKSSKLGKLD